VQGDIIFDHKSLLLANATVLIRLEDTSLADAPAKLIAQQVVTHIPEEIVERGKLPFALWGDIPDERATYTIYVLIDTDGDGKVSRGDYITMESYPVLTFGHPNYVAVRVHRIP
jgi:uncharacterized lipoprotein YbaY